MTPVTPEMTPLVEWVKAGAAVLAVGLAPFLTWRLARALAKSNSDLALATQLKLAELSQTTQAKLEADRQAAAQSLELLKTWLTEDMQKRLEANHAGSAKELEKVKAELVRRGRFETTVSEKRAEAAAAVLMTVVRYIWALEQTQQHVYLEPPKGASPRADAKDGLLAELARRLKALDAQLDAGYRDAFTQALVYLPDEASELLLALWKLGREMHHRQLRWVDAFDGRPEKLARPGWVEWPNQHQREIAELEDRARAILLPIARLEFRPADEARSPSAERRPG